jgi:hypothetical protein
MNDEIISLEKTESIETQQIESSTKSSKIPISKKKSKDIKDTKDAKDPRKARNTVTSLTRMFEKKKDDGERKSHAGPGFKLPIGEIAKNISQGLNSARESNNTNYDQLPEEGSMTSRKRTSSIFDKISIFTQNPTVVLPVKNEEEIKTLPLQKFVKVVDEQTKKIKWVESNPEELSSLQNKEKNNFNITESLDKDNEYNEKSVNAQEDKPEVIIDNIEIDDEQMYSQTFDQNNIINEQILEPLSNVPNQNENKIIPNLILEEKNQNLNKINLSSSNIITVTMNDIKQENLSNTLEEDEESELETDPKSKEMEEELEITIRKMIDEEGIDEEIFQNSVSEKIIKQESKNNLSQDPPIKISANFNLGNLSNRSNKSFGNKSGSGLSKSIDQSDKEKLDEFFTAINYIRNTNNVKEFDFDSNPTPGEEQLEKVENVEKYDKIKDKEKSYTSLNKSPLSSERDKDISFSPNISQKIETNKKTQIVELIERKSPDKCKNKNSTYAEKNEYNELVNSSVNNPDSVINISNFNVTHNNYNSIFQTVRSTMKDESQLFSDGNRKNNDLFTTNFPDEEIKEVRKITVEDDQMNSSARSLFGYINKYKIFIIVGLIVLTIVSLILLNIK